MLALLHGARVERRQVRSAYAIIGSYAGEGTKRMELLFEVTAYRWVAAEHQRVVGVKKGNCFRRGGR